MAEEHLKQLDKYQFKDESAPAEGPNAAVGVDTAVDYAWADIDAFETRWKDEAAGIKDLRELLGVGEHHQHVVYTYRSVSKALPQVKDAAQANKMQIYEGTMQVLLPEIEKLKDLLRFHQRAIGVFVSYVNKVAVARQKEQPTELLLWTMLQCVDMFGILDDLKNMKSSLNNDFSFYKRASGFLKSNSGGGGASGAQDDEQKENHTLYLFLANQNSITETLKAELAKTAGYDEVLIDMLNQAAAWLETGKYALPSEKFTLCRVMPYLLGVLDTVDNVFQSKTFAKKGLKVERFIKLFKLHPVVPLYGDMQIELEIVLRRSPNFVESVWGSSGSTSKTAKEYLLLYSLKDAVAEHDKFLAVYMEHVNHARKLLGAGARVESLPPVLCIAVSNATLDGLKLMAKWSAKIQEQSAWKYARPAQTAAAKADGVLDYERVIRLNYDSDERFALLRYLALVKGVGELLARNAAALAPVIALGVHEEVQQFVQGDLRDMIRFATKKKKAGVRADLMSLRRMLADWAKGVEPVDPALHGKKDDKRTDIPAHSARAVPPSTTQMELARSVVWGFLNKKKSELESRATRTLEDFYSKSFFYRYVGDVAGCVAKSTDLSDLWYREFYLELSKQLQFPIELSLPWILTDHILENQDDAGMLEYLFYPLDIYNDAAMRALHTLRSRFLYDEIQAEANLVFDQLLFKLSDKLYAMYKCRASSMLLDNHLKSRLIAKGMSNVRLEVPRSRYDVLLNQRHLHVLGRTLDLNRLIGQRMNKYVRDNLEYAIARFEASDAASLVELDGALANIRLMHRLLSTRFALDPMPSIEAEVNESISLVSYHNRIVLHAIFEVIADVAPNFVYNHATERFVRGPLEMGGEEVVRDRMPPRNV